MIVDFETLGDQAYILELPMPTRLIREGILTSDRVNSLSAKDEVFYRRLMSIVDDYGRHDARTAVLRAKLYPLQLDQTRESDVARGLAACEKANLIRCYEVEGKPYLQLEDFGQQTRTKSRCPDPPADVGVCAQLLTDDNSCKQPLTVVHLDESECEVGDEGADECECADGDVKPQKREHPKPRVVSGSSRKDFEPYSGSGSGEAKRQKAIARWHATAAPLIGKQDGIRHPSGSKQYNSDVTCTHRIFESVWPDDRDDEPPELAVLMKLAKESATRKKPLAWLQSRLKAESAVLT